MKRLVRFFCLFLTAAAALILIKDAAKSIFPLEYRLEITAAAYENNLDIGFVAAVIYAESGYDKAASSGVAHGLMQLTDETARFISEKTGLSYDERLSPFTNIRMGCWYLSYLKEKFHNEKTVLAAYNAGPSTVTGWLSKHEYSSDGIRLNKIPYKETSVYIRRVQIIKKIYELLYNV